ncbi:hypothetical protein [Streptomyces exfoliatus]|uniref:hypothetical protein n=1 Tax=Streptomyces exfoliatus TaxID=1905 RepID=UPI003C2BAC09
MSSIPRPRPNADDQHPSGAAPAASGPDRARDWGRARLHDIDMGFTHGWTMTAGWLRIASVIGVALVFLLIVYAIGAAALDAGRALPWRLPVDSDPTGLLATIDQPVRHYLDAHTIGLPITTTAAYGTWQAVGAASLVLGYFRSKGARLTWVLWVGSTIAMVWSATPEPGRTVATAITAVAGSALSLLALHGLSLTPDINIDVHTPAQPAPQVHAEIHLPRTEPKTPSCKPFDPQEPFQN